MMNTLRVRCQNFLLLAKHFRYREILRKLTLRAYYTNRSYGLRRDLDIPFAAPEAQIPLAVRPLNGGDISKLFANAATLSAHDQGDLYSRLTHWNADIPTCYAAVTGDDEPAYIQWLMGPEQNDNIQVFFHGTFPVLEPDEALLENALTLVQFRGKGVMPFAMARIAEQGTALGARYVLTFVEQHNIPSLKGCKKSGFFPYLVREERWRFFRRSLTFTRLPAGTPYPFDDTAAKPQGS